MRYRSTLTASCAAAVAPMRPHKCQRRAINCPEHERSLLLSLLPLRRDHPSLRRCSPTPFPTPKPPLPSPHHLLSETIGHPACLHRYVAWHTAEKKKTTTKKREIERDSVCGGGGEDVKNKEGRNDGALGGERTQPRYAARDVCGQTRVSRGQRKGSDRERRGESRKTRPRASKDSPLSRAVP